MTYIEQLRHPEWQKRRLHMLEAAGWACGRCEAKDKTLNVHHKRYVKGRQAWEYQDHELEVLCEPCHKADHAGVDLLQEVLLRLPHYERTRIAYLIAASALFGEMDEVLHMFDEDASWYAAGEIVGTFHNSGEWGLKNLHRLHRAIGIHALPVNEEGEFLVPDDHELVLQIVPSGER